MSDTPSAGDPGAIPAPLAGPIDAYLETSATLADFIAGEEREIPDADAWICAVDTEADSLHCYEEKLCLIQFASPRRLAIVDPLKQADLRPLMTFMERGVVWMHGADFDMRMLRRTFAAIPPVVFDTQTAARLLGHRRFGLAALVEDGFGVVLHKGSQKADWGQRPLPDKMLDYAINDVRYLLPMAVRLSSRLREVGRWEWFVESCAAARENVLVRPEKSSDDVWRIPGWGRLSARGLSFLRALWRWRDEEARLRDRPAFKVLSNDQLTSFSEDLESGRKVALSHRVSRSRVDRFERAVAAARDEPQADWPHPPKRVRTRKDPQFDARFERMRARRDRVARDLDIETALIASRSTLERIAADPDAAGELLLNWQRALLADALP